MPHTAQEIFDQADELAARFDNYEPKPGDVLDATTLRELRAAFAHRAQAEKELADAVDNARNAGHSWASIGAMVGWLMQSSPGSFEPLSAKNHMPSWPMPTCRS